MSGFRSPFDQDAEPVTGEVVQPSEALVPVTPGAGELVPLDKPEQVAAVVEALEAWAEQVYRPALRVLKAALITAADDEGSMTLRYGGVEVVCDGPGVQTHHWEDVPGMLDELRAAGLPEHRVHDLAREERSWRVDRAQANRISKTAKYRAIIERHDQVTPKTRSVRVKRTGE